MMSKYRLNILLIIALFLIAAGVAIYRANRTENNPAPAATGATDQIETIEIELAQVAPVKIAPVEPENPQSALPAEDSFDLESFNEGLDKELDALRKTDDVNQSSTDSLEELLQELGE